MGCLSGHWWGATMKWPIWIIWAIDGCGCGVWFLVLCLGGWYEWIAMLGVWLLCVCGWLMLYGWLLDLGGFTLVLGGELLWGVRWRSMLAWIHQIPRLRYKLLSCYRSKPCHIFCWVGLAPWISGSFKMCCLWFLYGRHMSFAKSLQSE